MYAVQAWCEPREVTAGPGETVMVRLNLRNAGSALDRYELRLAPDAESRTAVDRPGLPDVFSGERRTWAIVYTVGQDDRDVDTWIPSDGGAQASDFGAGGAFEESIQREPADTDVVIRVVSTRNSRVEAVAVFSIRAASADRPDRLASAPYPYESVDPYGGPRGGRGRGLRLAGVAAALVVTVVLVRFGASGPGDAERPAAQPVTGSSAIASPTAVSSPPVSDTPAPITPSTSTDATVAVPDVVGKSRTQGLAILREKGFRSTVVGVGDKIASTNPAPGKKVHPAKTTITVTLSGPTASASTPAATVSVPGVANLPYEQAEARLIALGFMVTRVDETSTSAAGTVLRTSPAEGATASPGSTVTVTVAKEDDAMTVVPNLYNRYMPDAFAMVRAAGLKFDLPYGDHLRMCRLRGFSPGEGAPIRKGGTIKVLHMVGCD
ncbi:PASTA domain-containing protein (plasmid) [Embleya sp. NBC_00888]|uniref:PASTA domain-containing protein n=1 Tax=Embleya sp. NBC_00888 TaxID=2975960 RepID=UPI00386866EF|nr:PASTA domain-containing protein [Embleya sp. NBC_00888]